MGRPKEVVRNYNLPDAEMIEVAEKTREAFLEDNNDFQVFDVDFKDPYATDWRTM